MALLEKLKKEGLTEEEIDEYRIAFCVFDTEGRGVISGRHLKETYGKLGVTFSDEDIKTMMKEFCGGDDVTQIEFPTFAITLHKKKAVSLLTDVFKPNFSGDSFSFELLTCSALLVSPTRFDAAHHIASKFRRSNGEMPSATLSTSSTRIRLANSSQND